MFAYLKLMLYICTLISWRRFKNTKKINILNREYLSEATAIADDGFFYFMQI